MEDDAVKCSGERRSEDKSARRENKSWGIQIEFRPARRPFPVLRAAGPVSLDHESRWRSLDFSFFFSLRAKNSSWRKLASRAVGDHLEDDLATTIFLIKLLFDQGDLSLPHTRDGEHGFKWDKWLSSSIYYSDMRQRATSNDEWLRSLVSGFVASSDTAFNSEPAYFTFISELASLFVDEYTVEGTALKYEFVFEGGEEDPLASFALHLGGSSFPPPSVAGGFFVNLWKKRHLLPLFMATRFCRDCTFNLCLSFPTDSYACFRRVVHNIRKK